ncbi:2-amino-4-hydroxy-6-hydroxymethyldihydropteridine diphosphokinase, partial [Microbacteriaceae bacterium K1510]|nr:2-amino-4-hydroxy-6-hydroxymethyldihydropteridine diphosphokinase [Microbacteriaceae bacterium K1510]
MAARLSTTLDPLALVRRMLELELALGRVREFRNGPRVIDLDLLVYRGITIDEPDLKLPHPHIGARAFVLAPLMDLDPELVIEGKSVREMYAAIDH